MALTVGTDTYVSLTDANTFWTNFGGGTNWAAASDTNKEQALREATIFVDRSYRWIGEHPHTVSQLLAWPRLNAWDKQGRIRTGIPQEIKDAVSWLANEALGGQLRPARKRGGRIDSITAGSVKVQYQPGAPANSTYEYVDLLVENLIIGSAKTPKMLKV